MADPRLRPERQEPAVRGVRQPGALDHVPEPQFPGTSTSSPTRGYPAHCPDVTPAGTLRNAPRRQSTGPVTTPHGRIAVRAGPAPGGSADRQRGSSGDGSRPQVSRVSELVTRCRSYGYGEAPSSSATGGRFQTGARCAAAQHAWRRHRSPCEYGRGRLVGSTAHPPVPLPRPCPAPPQCGRQLPCMPRRSSTYPAWAQLLTARASCHMCGWRFCPLSQAFSSVTSPGSSRAGSTVVRNWRGRGIRAAGAGCAGPRVRCCVRR